MEVGRRRHLLHWILGNIKTKEQNARYQTIKIKNI
jgi:hypothetical protein